MKKTVAIVVGILVVVYGAFLAKGYYNDRYVVSDSFYTQIPLDEVNEDSWLVDADGVQQEEGKAYELVGYNSLGEERAVHFTKKGKAEDYYAPGTYIKVNTSKTLIVGMGIVSREDVPEAALEKIETVGTR